MNTKNPDRDQATNDVGVMNAVEPAEPVELDDIIERIRNHHEAVCFAASDMLDQALEAGDALIEAKGRIAHGGWLNFLRKSCDLSDRTAEIYMRLAHHRAALKANPQRAANLSLRAALRMISPPQVKERPKKKAGPQQLSSLAWSDASVEERRRFLDAIGLADLLAALPRHFGSEIDRRVAALHAARAARDPSDKLTKCLRQALSTTSDAETCTAIGRMRETLRSTGATLHDLEIMISTGVAKAA